MNFVTAHTSPCCYPLSFIITKRARARARDLLARARRRFLSSSFSDRFETATLCRGRHPSSKQRACSNTTQHGRQLEKNVMRWKEKTRRDSTALLQSPAVTISSQHILKLLYDCDCDCDCILLPSVT